MLVMLSRAQTTVEADKPGHDEMGRPKFSFHVHFGHDDRENPVSQRFLGLTVKHLNRNSRGTSKLPSGCRERCRSTRHAVGQARHDD